MWPELDDLIVSMARREAACQLLPAPFVPTGTEGPAVRIRQVSCAVCGAKAHARHWPSTFRTQQTGGPLLTMLTCESLTARAVLPVVVAAERFPELREAQFTTRALAWSDLSHLPLREALARVDAAERWTADPQGSLGRVLPASTRPYRPDAGWREHRDALRPHFLTPHPTLPVWLDGRYATERRSAMLHQHEGT